jgi:hypothetical protein
VIRAKCVRSLTYACAGSVPIHQFSMAGNKTQWDKFHKGWLTLVFRFVNQMVIFRARAFRQPAVRRTGAAARYMARIFM